jgi:serine/threonine-protein kinase
MELLSVVQRARADLKAGRANATIQIPQVSHNDATQLLSQSDLAATTVLSTESIAATQLLNTNVNSTEVFDGFEFQDATDSALATFGRKKRGARLLIATALVILLGAGAGWWFGSGPGGLSMIPNLTSRSVTDAQVALEALKGNVEILEESSATVAKGLVIRTEPAAGSFYFGGTIKLFVSSGPKLVAAPDLIGMNVAEATAELIKNGFLLGQVNSWFNEAELGTVYSYLGSDGAEIPEGSRIDLSVSLGQIPVVAGLEQEAAVTLIEAAGLTIDKVTEDYSDTIAAGQVISMVPQSEPLGQGGLVNLVVSKGPNIVTVPNMVGETVLAAKTALQNLGLVVIVNTNQLQNKWGVVPVKRQSAAAGTQLRVGDSITIFTK